MNKQIKGLTYKFKHIAEVDADGQPVPVEAKQITIHGKTVDMTLNEILGDLIAFDKKLKELGGMLAINSAKVTNVGRQNPFVLELSKHDRMAVHLYHEALTMVEQTNVHINAILAQKKEALAEIEDIKKQIPELVDVPVVTEPIPDANTTDSSGEKNGEENTQA